MLLAEECDGQNDETAQSEKGTKQYFCPLKLIILSPNRIRILPVASDAFSPVEGGFCFEIVPAFTRRLHSKGCSLQLELSRLYSVHERAG